MYVAHVTDKGSIDKIKKEGYKCHDYSEHPIGAKCTTFFYPLNGIDRNLEFRPQNARIRGEDIDDEVYVIFDIEDTCKVGDLTLEGSKSEYEKRVSTHEDYQEGEWMRHRFIEPEVVCYNSIPPEKIVAILTHSEMKKLFEGCPKDNKTECMATDLKKCAEDTPREYRPHGLTEEEKANPELLKKLSSCIEDVEKKSCPESAKKEGKIDYSQCSVNPVAVCRASIEK